VLGAVLLGESLDYLSIAVAWAVGYPIAFAILVVLAVTTLRWSSWRYLRAVAGVAVCMIVAGLAAAILHHFLVGVPAGVRLVTVCAVVVLVAGFLLAYTQDLSLRKAVRSLRGEPDVADDLSRDVDTGGS
jgi:hypothetical protein